MNIWLVILTFVLATLGTVVLGLLSKWVDRKVTARIHWRVGPPWYQTFADVLKLLGKETIVPATAQKWTFLSAPIIGFAGAAVAASILWGANLTHASFVGDLIVVVYVLTLPSLAIIVGGMASGSPIAALGASREMKLVFAFELPMILALVTVILKAQGTLALDGILDYQASNGMFIGSVSGVIAFVVAVLSAQAKLGLVPFDIAEAETEIIAGPFTEYSGPSLAVFYLMKAVLLAVLPILLVTVFWGGFRGWGLLWGTLAYVLVLVLFVLIRNTNPRLRIDQALKFFWFGLTPVSILAVVLAGLGY
ncbi:MAG TPA: complex I subunit 1 family protein [Planctomycetota bacterium]|nr:complex I subunit 1 family protein [Planctomycetota bacterium]